MGLEWLGDTNPACFVADDKMEGSQFVENRDKKRQFLMNSSLHVFFLYIENIIQL